MLENNLLSVTKLAEVLSISKSKAFDMIRKGEIPCIRVGRNVRVREEDIQRFIIEHEIPSKRSS
jgi:putative molybdopterin biosynthesis protein